jgi:hypothetical protein
VIHGPGCSLRKRAETCWQTALTCGGWRAAGDECVGRGGELAQGRRHGVDKTTEWDIELGLEVFDAPANGQAPAWAADPNVMVTRVGRQTLRWPTGMSRADGQGRCGHQVDPAHREPHFGTSIPTTSPSTCQADRAQLLLSSATTAWSAWYPTTACTHGVQQWRLHSEGVSRLARRPGLHRRVTALALRIACALPQCTRQQTFAAPLSALTIRKLQRGRRCRARASHMSMS